MKRHSGTGRAAPRGGVAVVHLLGELLITAGVLVGLFIVWELWWTNLEADHAQARAARDYLHSIDAPVTPQQSNPQSPGKDYGPAPVSSADRPEGEVFGLAYIPRFGKNYAARPLVQGTGQEQLDTLGLGHYPATDGPGEQGNFALAGHRQTHGAVLDNIDALMPGDNIYVQTAAGYYVYTYRNSQIVLPTDTKVLAPVPTEPGVEATQSVLTLTSCNPRFGTQERIIAYSVLTKWQPLRAGPPAEIAAAVRAAAGKG